MLHRQAVEAGLSDNSEGARLDFLALAERARVRGNRPGALLAYLLREGRFDFISQADEDAAQARLRELRDGPCRRESDAEQGRGGAARKSVELSDDEKFVTACLRVAQQQRIADPSLIARQVKGWSRQQWDEAHWAFQQAQFERYQSG